MIFNQPSLCAGLDEDCRQMVSCNLSNRATLHPNTHATSIEKTDTGSLLLTVTCIAGDATFEVDQVLMAAGRSPRTAGLGLEVHCSSPPSSQALLVHHTDEGHVMHPFTHARGSKCMADWPGSRLSREALMGNWTTHGTSLP
jgi:hypothetical protein